MGLVKEMNRKLLWRGHEPLFVLATVLIRSIVEVWLTFIPVSHTEVDALYTGPDLFAVTQVNLADTLPLFRS